MERSRPTRPVESAAQRDFQEALRIAAANANSRVREYRLPLGRGPATNYRNRVLGLLSLLLVITYLDRVCIAVAGPRMQEALHIGPLAWGWVTGIFTLSYAAFEIPSGALGDRIGPRRVLTRIVLWWSGIYRAHGYGHGLLSALVDAIFLWSG